MPVSGSILLDSNIVIAHFRQDDSVTQQLLATLAIYLPVTALGELYHGAYKSANPPSKLAQLQLFLPWVTLLPITEQTAQHYGTICAALAQAGTPIPDNDIWIAALAMEHNLPLATRDAHFKYVQKLALVHW